MNKTRSYGMGKIKSVTNFALFFCLLPSIISGCKPLAATPPSTSPFTSSPVAASNRHISASNAAQMVQLEQIGIGTITDIAVSQNGQYIAFACSRGIMILNSDLSDFRFINTSSPVSRVLFSPDSAIVASILKDRSLKLWKVTDDSSLFDLQGQDLQTENNLSFSPDGKYIAASGITDDEGYGVYIWDVSNGSVLRKLEPYNGSMVSITSIDHSPDGSKIAAGLEDGFVTIWDIGSGDITQKISAYSYYSSVTPVLFLPDGKRLAVANLDYARFTIWNVTTGEKIENIPEHTFTQAYFSPDAMSMFFIEKNELFIWETQVGKFLSTASWNLPPITNIALFPDGTKMVLIVESLELQNSIEVRQTNNGALVGSRNLVVYQSNQFAFLPDRSMIDIGFSVSDCSLRVMHVDDETVLMQTTIADIGYCPDGFALSENGSKMASFSEDGTITLFSIGTPVNSLTISDQGNKIYSLALSPDGSIIAAGEYNGNNFSWEIALINTVDGSVTKRIDAGNNSITGLSFSSDGSILASIGMDGGISLWDMQKYAQASTFNPEIEGVNNFVLSHDGLQVALSEGKSVYLCNAKSGKVIYTFQPEAYYTSTFQISFSPDDKLMAVGDDAGKITIWSVEDGAKQAVLKGHTQEITSLRFSEDGSRLVSGSSDGTVRFWGIK